MFTIFSHLMYIVIHSYPQNKHVYPQALFIGKNKKSALFKGRLGNGLISCLIPFSYEPRHRVGAAGYQIKGNNEGKKGNRNFWIYKTK